MPTPQQPELARSQRSEATAELSAKTRTGGPTTEEGPTGPVPEDNLPGHHPETEQDKPGVPPAARARRSPARAAGATRPRAGPSAPPKKAAAAPAKSGGAAATTAPRASKTFRRFPFAFERRVLPFSAAVGVLPGQAWAEVGHGELRLRFGLWSLRTPLSNVVRAEVTGPYALAKVAGPPRLSVTDGGATFATSTRQGVCIRFREPVPGALPFGLLRHSAVTVTVEDPDAMADLLARVADENAGGGRG